MGMCISLASSEIHGAPKNEVYDENIITFEASNKILLSGNNNNNNNNQRLCSVYSKQGTKGFNQDAASIHQGYGMEDGAFCGVFDGHGRNGHIVSNIINTHLSSLILSQKNVVAKFEDNTEDGNDDKTTKEIEPKSIQKWKQAIVSAFKVMDKEVKLQENLDCYCSGSTAIVVIRQGEYIVIANLGDSRAVLGTICDDELKAIQLTTDLKPGLPSEAERIRRSNGCVYALKEEAHIQRMWLPNNENSVGLAMSRAFGDFMFKDHGLIAIPQVSCRTLTSSDQFIVLASDGVWDVLSNIEVASIVWTTDSEEEAARVVVEAANAAWKRKYPFSKVDDCTVVCLFLQKKQQSMKID